MIQLQRVSKRYQDGQQALSDVTFEIGANEIVFLTGHSGAGKSSLLKLLMLTERPTRGRLWVDGQDLNTLGKRDIPRARRSMGAVFQNHHLLFDRTVYANVALPLETAGYARRHIAGRVNAALDRVGLLSRAASQPRTLSTGERQRVGIARAIVHWPSLLLADEPTGNLDPELSADIMHLFEQLKITGATVLIVSHDMSLVSRLGHRVLTLREGRLIGDQPARAAP